jgi:hypothetical protein
MSEKKKSQEEIDAITQRVQMEYQQQVEGFIQKIIKTKGEPRKKCKKLDFDNLSEEDKLWIAKEFHIVHGPLINGKKRYIAVKQGKKELDKIEILY